MKKSNLFKIILISFLSLIIVACGNNKKEENQQEKSYQTVENDPTGTRIYTLENGLKVYLSPNDEEPRVQTSIAVRAGSKNDPADATGLAHYLEHMLFKGTDQYGTTDFSKEGPLLEKIDSLYEVYRKTTEDAARKVIYAKIDSISQIASTFAIANEYDKMVSEMGAKGTNAYTSQERTVYVNNIPSNQLEKWLTVEAERFRNPQLRLFHTELEAVYEEKNRSLDSDFSKAFYGTLDATFPNHQYGQQTTIGTIDHLKNPSLTEIKKYFNTYYVPNNMAICLSGDFNPDSLIEVIKANFGGMERKETPDFEVAEEKPIQKPIVKEVLGPDQEFLYMAFRFPGAGKKEADLMSLCDMILANSTAGLIDLNLNQKQAVLRASSFPYILTDYSVHFLNGSPKQEQSLEEVRDLILAQIDSLKTGAFPDWLVEAVINDLKLSRIRQSESNRGRMSMMVDAFIQQRDWEDEINSIDRLKQYTKEDIMNFSKENYSDNYAILYKRTGKDETVKEVIKPEITPIEVNRDDESAFLSEIREIETAEIEPLFLDYKKDIQESKLENGILVRSIQNTTNQLFSLYYVFDMGKNHDLEMALAIQYLPFLGTSKYSPSEIQQEFYKIGCEFNVSSGAERTYVTLSGLNENFEEGVKLFEHLLADAQAEETALKNLVSNILKQRADAKLNKGSILFGGMASFAKYGDQSPFKNILKAEELQQVEAEALVDKIHQLSNYEHRVLYYGPQENSTLAENLNQLHQTTENLLPIPEGKIFAELENESNQVFVVDYDMKQAEIYMLSKKELYNPKTVAAAAIYNEYFGAGMGSILFQEMRESKALAYSVYSAFQSPIDTAKAHYVLAYIGTQADKLKEAMQGMTELLNNMPESEKSFELAKKAALEKIRTERITKSSKLWNYETALRRGLDYDLRKDVYEAVPNMSMEDLKKFHEEYVKDGKYNIMLIGNTQKLDLAALENYGSVKQLNLEEVFGY